MKSFRLFLVFLSMTILAVSCKKESTTTTTDTSATYSSDTSVTGTSTTATTATTNTSTTSTPASLNDTDKDFVTSVGKGGMAEVDLAQDALSHATNADVKSFAQKLVDDHTKANQELTAFASTKGVTMPSEAQGEMKEAKVRLMKLTGKTYDQGFLKQMVEDHQATIKKFEEESAKAADTDLKAWVDKTLPTLKTHLSMAKDLQAKMGK